MESPKIILGQEVIFFSFGVNNSPYWGGRISGYGGAHRVL